MEAKGLEAIREEPRIPHSEAFRAPRQGFPGTRCYVSH